MLPPALLDLLCHRLSTSSNVSFTRIYARSVRHVQQLATHSGPALDNYDMPMFNAPPRVSARMAKNGQASHAYQAQRKSQAFTELESRVKAFKATTIAPTMDKPSFDEGPRLREETLRDIYADLLSYPEADMTSSASQPLMDAAKVQYPDLVRDLEERLSTFEMTVDARVTETGLSSRLLARLHQNLSATDDNKIHASNLLHSLPTKHGSSLRTLVIRLQSVFDKLETAWSCIPLSTATVSVPLGFISNTEWAAFLEVCLETDDALSAEAVLDLMKRSGLSPSDEQFDKVLDWYAARGLVDDADEFFSRLNISISRDPQRDLLIKARVKANRLDDACAFIHSLETQTTPAPIRSYTRVIQALVSQRGPGSEQCKAQAWDMFSHMRYVAHATPDCFLYTVMMRACAESAQPEPERALDLFTEMTVDKGILPTKYAYNAVILTCARSKTFALEAFRLVREMVNSHRDAYGEVHTHLRPDNATFCALLEAAKRTGDLLRTRRILMQMTNYAQATHGSEQPVFIDRKVMTHVFHAYASYRPPFRREAVSIVSEDEGEMKQRVQGDTMPGLEEQAVEVADESTHPGVPQSRQEVIKEVSALWERILRDQRNATAPNQNDASPPHLVFGRVFLDTNLLNAYMAVHYRHSPPTTAYDVYTNLYEAVGVPRDAFTYVLALEAYSQGSHWSKEESQLVFSVARDVWVDWRRMEDGGVSQMTSEERATGSSSGVDARIVERAWRAMMRLMLLNGRLDEAIELVRQFVERYPPALVKQPSSISPARSTRTSLYAERPIVRLTERSTVPEDRIPPFLTFKDLSPLHHHAVSARRTDYIAYLTWVTKAYEGALRRRREATLRPIVARDKENK